MLPKIKFIKGGKKTMKKFFSLLLLFSIFSIVSFMDAHAQDTTCDAQVFVHYHRFNGDYDGMMMHTWGTGSNGSSGDIALTGTSNFGRYAIINVCSDADDEIGLIPQRNNFEYKDGVDVNGNGDVDNKYIDVTDIRGTNKAKNVFVLQGAAEVYYEDPDAPYKFNKTRTLIVIYHNPTGNEKWDDFYTWPGDVSVPFVYTLGIDGGTDPDLFRVAVYNVPVTDEIGFIIRQDKAWAIKDDAWKNQLTEEITDENGHTYKPNGDRLINVGDLNNGVSTKVVFVLGGVAKIYEDYEEFVSEAFKIELEEALIRSNKVIQITFNQAITYGEGGPNIEQFQVVDQDGNDVEIERITYDTLRESGSVFNIVVAGELVRNKNYTVSYNYETFGNEFTTSVLATVQAGVFPDDVVDEVERNIVSIIIASVIGVIALGGIIAAVVLSRRRGT